MASFPNSFKESLHTGQENIANSKKIQGNGEQ